MATQALAKTISPAEYLAQEEIAIERHEYIAGQVRVVPSECLRHSSLGVNVMFVLGIALKHQPYYVAHAAQRLWVPQPQVYLYPDVMVASKPLVLQEGRDDTVMNIRFAAEILSPSTRNYDRSEKFHYYRSIPEFQEYLLIEQDRVFVEHYVRTEAKKWRLTEHTEIEDVIKLESVDCEMAIADIYEDVEL